MKLILSGIVVHLIFLASIFDVYFNSPVIQGIEAYYPKFSPKAKRLVLFVADGLRASTFFSNHMNASPYLRDIVETRGSWGVSHTRVPTESRPGHVALIAGLYEDPSAVTKVHTYYYKNFATLPCYSYEQRWQDFSYNKCTAVQLINGYELLVLSAICIGWKENPVDFDSVFNRSRHTWAWGSPDILPMFAKGEASGRVTTHCYSTSMQKFSGDDSNEKLDHWVFNNVLNFFANSSSEAKEDGLIFFLHLLGIDTAGHATKPHSRQYMDNIKLVDFGVKKVEAAIEKFYGNDGETAYIFTSDHGMTDWGSHGAGLPDETETPLVVWGSGLSGPILVDPKESDDGNLNKFKRRDVEQADIAALMSALLAIPTPTNSVGLIPRELLSASKEWIVEAMSSNAHQILLQLQRTQDLVHGRLLPIFVRPFPQLENLNFTEVEKFVSQGLHDSAIDKIEEIEKLALDGIQYYQEYFSRGLKWSVTASHIIWLAYLAKSLLFSEVSNKQYNSPVLQVVFISFIVLICALVIIQQLPWQYIIYYSLPSVLLLIISKDIKMWWPQLASGLQNKCTSVFLVTVGLILAVALLVVSFYHRASLSLGLVLLSTWPFAERKFGNCVDIRLCIGWAISCIALSVFPVLPVIGRDANYITVLWSGLLTTFIGFLAYLIISFQSGKSKKLDKILLLVQVVITCVAVSNVHFTAKSFAQGLGLIWYNQLISWIILVSSFTVPLFVSTTSEIRLLSVWLSLASILILLSVSHEPLFLLCLLTVMSLYSSIETKIAGDFKEMKKSANLSFGDLRRAYFYLFFTVLAFFGLGNIASLNSFDPSWVRCFVTTFSPHFMMVLILLKTIVPFLAVACGTFASKRPVQWLLVLGYCDGMSLTFFHLVVTRGSWLDVGQSISHFVIAHACVLFLLLLYRVAEIWLTLSWCRETQKSVSSLENPPQYFKKSHRE